MRVSGFVSYNLERKISLLDHVVPTDLESVDCPYSIIDGTKQEQCKPLLFCSSVFSIANVSSVQYWVHHKHYFYLFSTKGKDIDVPGKGLLPI